MGTKIGKISGIKIELHFTFIVIIAAVLLAILIFDPKEIVVYSLFLFFLFGSVLFHELVHSIVATNLGMKVKKIILLPIGGIAFTEGLLKNANDELKVAIAGPLFNFLIAIITLIVGQLLRIPFYIDFESVARNNPLNMLIWVNFILGAFNLIPALPLDGGRVLRAILTKSIGELKATRIITKFSLLFSVILFAIGLLAMNIIVMAVAGFLFFGAQQEAEVVELKNIIRRFSVEEAILRPKLINANSTAKKALEKFVKEKRSYFVVRKNKRYFVLTVKSVARLSENEKIEKALQPLKIVNAKISIDKLFMMLLENNLPVIGIAKNGKLIGTIDINTIRFLVELAKNTVANYDK